MGRTRLILVGLLIAIAIQAQPQSKSTSSYFDDSEMRSLTRKSIMIRGEVQNPGTIDLSTLPIRSVALKEMAFENGKQGFKGNEHVTGYLLKDLLAANLKPTPEMLREGLMVVSAKDGYRVVNSLSKIMNRSDNQEFILVDQNLDLRRDFHKRLDKTSIARPLFSMAHLQIC